MSWIKIFLFPFINLRYEINGILPKTIKILAIISILEFLKKPIESLWVEKPPVAIVVIEWAILSKIDIPKVQYKKEQESVKIKYVVIIIFTAAAILTPPDPVTQIGLAIPLLILYELSIFSVKMIEKKVKEKEHA